VFKHLGKKCSNVNISREIHTDQVAKVINDKTKAARVSKKGAGSMSNSQQLTKFLLLSFQENYDKELLLCIKKNVCQTFLMRFFSEKKIK
jgi:hypothetical protein